MIVSSADNKPGGPYRKPRADLYTMLLIISLIAILLAILCLYLEMKPYDFQFKAAMLSADRFAAGGQWLVDSGRWMLGTG